MYKAKNNAGIYRWRKISRAKGQVLARLFFLSLLPVIFGLMLNACATHRQTAIAAVGLQCDPVIDEAVSKGDWEKALAEHEQLLARSPQDCLARYHLGYIWGQLGNRVNEIQNYEKAQACGYTHDDRLFFNLGMARGDLGDLDGALKAFERAVAVNPENADNYFGLGLMYQATKRSQEAEKTWLQGLRYDPKHGEIHIALARLYLDQGQWDKARIHIDAVVQADPGNDEALELRKILRSREALEYGR